jgi:hypothetical protein
MEPATFLTHFTVRYILIISQHFSYLPVSHTFSTNLFVLHIKKFQFLVAQAKMIGLDLSRQTNIPIAVLRGLSQSFYVQEGDVSPIRSLSLFPTPLHIHYLQIILPLDGTDLQPKLLENSLSKPNTNRRSHDYGPFV